MKYIKKQSSHLGSEIKGQNCLRKCNVNWLIELETEGLETDRVKGKMESIE